MKRFVSLPVALALILGTWVATPAGQPQLPTVSNDLVTHVHGVHKHRVIVQSANASALSAVRRGVHGLLRREMAGAMAIEVTDEQLEALQRNPLFANISGDLPVAADLSTSYDNAVTNKVTGAVTLWQGMAGGLLGLGGTPGNTGSGVTVAVLDSGIATHTALDTRVLGHVNLVSDEPGVTGDPFGHGTHLAGIIGGNRTAASTVTSAFTGGSAPSVKLVDVRVLGRGGSGRTSDVIAGIDWVIAYRQAFSPAIRVINLSLGHPVTEPSATDPLCRAVSRAVAAGITVVVSAGNYGLTAAGEPVLGGITSPGNSPDALTVGSTDTKDTVDQSDDVVAPYSSRGPARYEIVVKPDIVAPGTKLVSLEAQNSYISAAYPQWHIAGASKNAYLRLSGSSMSTAVVSGGVALLLTAEPQMGPAQVRMALQMSARFMPKDGLIAAGTGSVDFARALKISQSGLINSLISTVTNLLGGGSGAAFRDRGTLIGRIYDRSGVRLLGLLDFLPLFKNADSAERGVLHLLGSSNPIGNSAPNYVVWGNVAGWSTSYYVVWGNSIQAPSGQYVVWGNNNVSDPNYVVWGNADTADGSYVVWGNSLGGGH
jgi:serine protease AprX